jgi:hypothetical protein
VIDHYYLPQQEIAPSIKSLREVRRAERLAQAARGPSQAALALRKAIGWQDVIHKKGLRRADIARRERCTRARVSQVMTLLDLPADMQQDLLANVPFTRSWSIRHALELAQAA